VPTILRRFMVLGRRMDWKKTRSISPNKLCLIEYSKVSRFWVAENSPGWKVRLQGASYEK
jgi:hypothetical protein